MLCISFTFLPNTTSICLRSKLVLIGLMHIFSPLSPRYNRDSNLFAEILTGSRPLELGIESDGRKDKSQVKRAFVERTNKLRHIR